MSRDWYFSEGTKPFQVWYRSSNQRIECPLGGYPVISADIDECKVYEGETPIFTRLGTVEINAVNLTPEECAKAVEIQAFFTDLIGKNAASMIEAHIAARG